MVPLVKPWMWRVLSRARRSGLRLAIAAAALDLDAENLLVGRVQVARLGRMGSVAFRMRGWPWS